MTHDEYDAFERDIVRVAVRTDALVFAEMDSEGAVQYALFPRRRMALEYATAPRGIPHKQRRRRRGTAALP